jgi:hypothetical protein
MESVDLRKRSRRSNPSQVAVLVVLAIILPCVLVWFFNRVAAHLIATVAIVGTSLWVALDSARLNVSKYKSQVAAHPFVLFTACVGLWPVVFPVYLVTRSRIRAGLVQEQENQKPRRRMLYVCIAAWCIPVAVVALSYWIAQSMSQALAR